MKMFGELRLVRALTDEQIAAMRDPRLVGTVKLPRIEDAVKAGGFLAGRLEEIIEALTAVEKRYPGLDRIICATPLDTPLDVQLEDLDRFAKEVIPAFRDTRTAAVDPRDQPPGPRAAAGQHRRRVVSRTTRPTEHRLPGRIAASRPTPDVHRGWWALIALPLEGWSATSPVLTKCPSWNDLRVGPLRFELEPRTRSQRIVKAWR
jgi:hypothetical protein